MNTKEFDRIPHRMAVVLVVLVLAACTIHLRGDEGQASSVDPIDQASDPLAAKLEQCRSVTSEQKDAIAECRKAWAERRRQFLGQNAPATSSAGSPQAGSSLFVPPKDESRLPSGYPPARQSGKE